MVLEIALGILIALIALVALLAFIPVLIDLIAVLIGLALLIGGAALLFLLVPADWQPTALVVTLLGAAGWLGSRSTEKDKAIKREQEAQARHEIEMAEISAKRAATERAQDGDRHNR